ncbi:MAG: decarboxylating 6-phosphogluconate dehydrogenase [Armatimonadetes bacterium]|nr:decarboxylating 6-phosphogluconate dehydrogenase [Armatimonadota bacterium]
MELGMIGLGRMGGNMAERLLRAGHRVIGTSRTRGTVEEAMKRGVEGVFSVQELVTALTPPRAVWVMVPAGQPTDDMLAHLADLLSPGDIVIDGGNSNYRDTMRRAARLADRGLRMVDVGTSGGIWGLEHGYSLMVGGEAEVVEHLRPVLEALAPAPDRGWGHVGPHGAGHFVKMVHNGIEYGMMQAFAEGFAIMSRKTELGLDLHQVAEIWRDGSVVRSWLLDLISGALETTPDLTTIAPYVEDSGEGRWTVQEAIDLDVSAPVITLSLLQRLRSRDEESIADRLLALMRQQFGGHAVRREGE